MSNTVRIALVAVAALIAAGAFVGLRPSSDPAPDRQVTGSGPAGDVGEDSTSTEAEERPARPRPRYQRIRVRGGQPVGGVKELRVDAGEVARIAVSADAPDEVHLHGYDREAAVGPGRTARLRFKADLEGIFELELHGSGALLAKLRVEP